VWTAAIRKKVDALLGSASPAWRRALVVSEDILTATVCERLAYLPGELPVRLLLRSAEPLQIPFIPTPEPIIASEAWPNVSDEGRTEPDWLFETRSYRFLIEAKWGAGVVPERAQLERQYSNFGRTRGKRGLVQIALVQSGKVVPPSGQSVIVVKWGRLRDEVMKELKERSHEHSFGLRRTLEDILQALDFRGLDSVYLETLPAISVDGSLGPLVLEEELKARLPEIPELTISPDAEIESWS
jgi:hypothetical protein